MSMEIWQDETLICSMSQFPSDTYEVELQVQFPSSVSFIVGNKDLARDTIIDDRGNMIENKFIHLIEASLGRLPIEESHLLDEIELKSNDEPRRMVYWDRPGTATFNLNAHSLVEWHLRHLIKKVKS